MSGRIAILCCLVAVITSSGCPAAGPNGDDHTPAAPQSPEDVDATDAAESIPDAGEMRLAGARLVVTNPDENSARVTDLDFEPGDLPEEADWYEGAPLATESRHPFGFHFDGLPYGTYDVKAKAVDDRGRIIPDCHVAAERDLVARPGAVLDSLLVVQCDVVVDRAPSLNDTDTFELPPAGVLASLYPNAELFSFVALNHPPRVKEVSATPSEGSGCPTSVELCATVDDPDGDPVVLAWRHIEGPQPIDGPRETKTTEVDGVTHQCVEYDVPAHPAHHVFELTAFDQFIVGQTRITAEHWLRQRHTGDRQLHSRDSATTSFDVHCPRWQQL